MTAIMSDPTERGVVTPTTPDAATDPSIRGSEAQSTPTASSYQPKQGDAAPSSPFGFSPWHQTCSKAIARTQRLSLNDYRAMSDNLRIWRAFIRCIMNWLSTSDICMLSIDKLQDIPSRKAFLAQVDAMGFELVWSPRGSSLARLHIAELVPTLEHLDSLLSQLKYVTGEEEAFDKHDIEEGCSIRMEDLNGFKWDVVWGLLLEIFKLHYAKHDEDELVAFCDLLAGLGPRIMQVNNMRLQLNYPQDWLEESFQLFSPVAIALGMLFVQILDSCDTLQETPGLFRACRLEIDAAINRANERQASKALSTLAKW